LKDTKERLEDSMKTCDEKEAAVKELACKAEQQQVEVNTLTQQLSSLTIEKEELEAKIQEEKELKEKETLERAELEQKKKEEREKNDKENRNFFAIRLHKIQTAHADETDKMTADMTTLENRIKELTAQKNSEVVSKNASVESNSQSVIVELEDRISVMTREVEESRGELEELNATLDELNIELNTMRGEKNVLQTQKNILQDENDVIKNRVAALQGERDNLMTERKNETEREENENENEKEKENEAADNRGGLDNDAILTAHTAALHVLERNVQEAEESNLILTITNTALTKTVEELGVKLSLFVREKEELKSQIEAVKLSGDVTAVLDSQKVTHNHHIRLDWIGLCCIALYIRMSYCIVYILVVL
jgi:chromosome segregation ATPase